MYKQTDELNTQILECNNSSSMSVGILHRFKMI